MNLPSKELLSEVLGENVTSIQELSSDAIFGGRQAWITSKSHDCAINIHELAHKCKEWAFQHNFIVNSELHYHKGCCSIYDSNGDCLNGKGIFEDTEPEAIFKACEWILKQE